MLNFHPGAHMNLHSPEDCLKLIAESINLVLDKTRGVTAVIENTAATFTAVLKGRPPYLLQWFKNGVAVPGATNNTLTFANTEPAQSGPYQLVAQNDLGAVTSAEASPACTRRTPSRMAL